MAHVRRKLATTKKHEDVILVLLEREPKNPFFIHMNRKKYWDEHKETVLEEWISEYPGTRPKTWWQYEAPQAKRNKLKGSGKLYPGFDNESNYRNKKGIPEPYWYQTIDINSPPVFESQAAYLKRHKLFMDGEEGRLNKNHYKAESF